MSLLAKPILYSIIIIKYMRRKQSYNAICLAKKLDLTVNISNQSEIRNLKIRF